MQNGKASTPEGRSPLHPSECYRHGVARQPNLRTRLQESANRSRVSPRRRKRRPRHPPHRTRSCTSSLRAMENGCWEARRRQQEDARWPVTPELRIDGGGEGEPVSAGNSAQEPRIVGLWKLLGGTKSESNRRPLVRT